ncbi:hypothetical protein CDN99_05245 [Roseateles aquatilis]|uniref:Uncharacterized protein n=1 Tax=Roseateles aquatilis TaxID=431061 RepID=A0A246JMJ8_9BURK|nr:hypothetical protein [Roseateles aquatilis]OWQ93841.1 hypothetical protein CDN99_05245 [Roseateles aquatilis]
MGEVMRELTSQELELVSGGDSWAGTPEGRAPYVGRFTQCMIDSVGWSQGRAEWAGAYCGAKLMYEALTW